MKDNRLTILKFDAVKPPIFKEVKGKDYVLYGTDKKFYNRYPDFLISLYNESSIHNAIINGKVKYIAGQGWVVDKKVTLSESTEINSWINEVGNESLFSFTEKIAKDRELFGGFCFQPIWNKNERVGLYHIDFSKVRVSADGESFFYTSNWKVAKPQLNKDYKVFSKFDFNKKGKDTLVYFKDYRPDLQDYPLPNYQAGINYISADIDISKFVASNTANGFSAGTIVNLYNGEPEDLSKKKIEKQFKDKFTGSENAGGIVISFNDKDTKGAEIIPISDNGQDNRFINLNEQVKASIFTCHEATNPVLFGVKGENGLSNNADEIRTASEYLQNMYVTPKQRVFIDLINEFAVLNGWSKCLTIRNLTTVKAQLSEQTLLQILDTNELRAIAGYEPIKQDSKQDFSKHESFYNDLRKTGYSDEELEVVEENFIEYNPFTFALTVIDKDILGLIVGNPKVTLTELISLSGYKSKELIKILNTLESEGLITQSNGSYTPTSTEKKSELITVYKYSLRPDAPALKTESRQFCQTLMGINRSYTREQISLLSNKFGTDVWSNRGGWYNNPITHKKQPFCRHIWKSRTVKLKK